MHLQIRLKPAMSLSCAAGVVQPLVRSGAGREPKESHEPKGWKGPASMKVSLLFGGGEGMHLWVSRSTFGGFGWFS